MTGRLPTKPCTVCGRVIEWRKKWEREWEQVRYCSTQCRRSGRTPQDAALETAILALLAQRKGGATICPSEAAQRVATLDASVADTDSWRVLREPARQAARRLVVRGAVEIVQGGKVVDPSTARGPIRIRLRR